MYAQVTLLRAPMGKMAELRTLIQDNYLPSVSQREGFLSAHLLEQIDDPDSAQLVVYWSCQAAVEDANRTGLLRQTIESLVANMPYTKIQRQGYIVNVSTEAAMTA